MLCSAAGGLAFGCDVRAGTVRVVGAWVLVVGRAVVLVVLVCVASTLAALAGTPADLLPTVVVVF